MMKKTSNDKTVYGIAFCVFTVFFLLKITSMTAVAEWSWLWIASPLWIVAAIDGVVVAASMFLAIVGMAFFAVLHWMDR